MTTPNAAANGFEAMTGQAELEEELRQADADFARGDFIDITLDELDRCIAAGQWPWPEESSA
jgi:hypothetical protein